MFMQPAENRFAAVLPHGNGKYIVEFPELHDRLIKPAVPLYHEKYTADRTVFFERGAQNALKIECPPGKEPGDM